MTDLPPSPDLLGAPPTRGAGVRRLNRVPLMVATAILILGLAPFPWRGSVLGSR